MARARQASIDAIVPHDITRNIGEDQMKNSRTVPYSVFGKGAFQALDEVLAPRRNEGGVVFLVDHYFRNKPLIDMLPTKDGDIVELIDSTDEPTTELIDNLTAIAKKLSAVGAVVGIGGGCTLDSAKAVSNLLGNGGKAEDYQGWDLLKKPGVYKVGVPTLSGTGAEASRTCVLMNEAKKLKLGMNSEFTVFDQLVLDPDLSKTVPRDQYFYTAMDTYIHCVESLKGSLRHPLADGYSREALRLTEELFESDDMMSDENREKLMVASYFGGCAIANSSTGVVHPLSYGLSVVFHTHHCLANCLVMDTMDEYYGPETKKFREYMYKQGVKLPKGIAANKDEATYKMLYEVAARNEKPLTNALGSDYKRVLTFEKAKALYQRM